MTINVGFLGVGDKLLMSNLWVSNLLDSVTA